MTDENVVGQTIAGKYRVEKVLGKGGMGIVVGGVGLLGVTAGAALGAVALSKKSESDHGHCNAVTDVCDTQGLALRHDGLLAATGSTVGVLAGGLALTAGLVLIGTAPSTRRRAPAPSVSMGPSGASLSWRW